MQEARELANDPCTDYSGAPLEVRPYLHAPALDLTVTRSLRTIYLWVAELIVPSAPANRLGTRNGTAL